MKYMVIYVYGPKDKGVIGFANSLEEFLAENNKKTYPYNYEKENIRLVELHTDVFAFCRLEGDSNFVDYLRF